MNLTNTLPAVDFIAQRSYRDHMSDFQSKVYDALIDRFPPLPPEIEKEDPGALTEVGSFLINQGVCVEILRNEYQNEPDDYTWVIDVAYVADCYNLTCVGSGASMSISCSCVPSPSKTQ